MVSRKSVTTSNIGEFSERAIVQEIEHNIEEEGMTPHAHTACTRFFPHSHPQNDPREDSASCFSFALIRIHAASRSFCMDVHSALVRLGDRVGF